MMTFRIVHKSFSHSLVSSGLPGRWNKAGQKVIYAAESIALAFLESMVRRQGVGFNDDFKIMFIEIPKGMTMNVIKPAKLIPGWDDLRSHDVSQQLASTWYKNEASAVLRVPSVVLPHSFNFVFNTLHPDFKKISIAGVTPLLPDQRIEEILRTKT